MDIQRLAGKRRQRGVALIVGLLLLIVITLIGVTAMQTTTLEERMAGNLLDQNLAFQSAETALRDAESFIETLATLADFDNSDGLYTKNSAPDPQGAATWQGTASRTAASPLADIVAPRYFIEERGRLARQRGTAINIVGYGESVGSGVATGFRIVARGTGGSGGAQAILESYYGKRL